MVVVGGGVDKGLNEEVLNLKLKLDVVKDFLTLVQQLMI